MVIKTLALNNKKSIQGYCLSYEPGTEEEMECDVPSSSSTPSTSYEYEQALDRSDGSNGVDETEFVSSRQNTLRSSGSTLTSAVSSTVLLASSAILLHYI